MIADQADSRPRLFFGLACPATPEIRKLKHELRATEAARQGVLRVVSECHLHLTLRYLGRVPEDRLQTLDGMARELARHYRPFSCQLEGLGHFSHAVWVGARAPVDLYDLASELDHRLLEAEFSADPKPFRPHVTVGRLRRRDPELVQALCGGAAQRVFGRIPVHTLRLYRSDPGKGTSQYTTIAAFPL